MAKSEAKCVEVSVQWNQGGKVAIRDFGKISSSWGASVTRKYAIPDEWTQEDIDSFQIEERQRLEDLLDPVDQEAFDVRFAQRNWDD